MKVDLVKDLIKNYKDQFQQIDVYKDGKNIELPIFIDQLSTGMLSNYNDVTIEASGWHYFKRLRIQNRSVNYLSGSC